MTTTPKVLIAMQPIPAATTLAYTSPINGKGTWIDQFDVCNYNATVSTIRIYIVPNGQTVGTTYMRVHDKSVASKQTLGIDEMVGTFLGPGDSIHWFCTNANATNGGVSGREIT